MRVPKQCSVEGCDRPHLAKGLCGGHYQRLWKTGDVQPEKPLGTSHYGEDNPNWRGGRTAHPLYLIYHDMLARCHSPRHTRYQDYGGRGIRVCERWRDDFWAFVEDVGPRPEGVTKGGYAYWQLDRTDNDGNYEPGNVRWATPRQQASNQRPKRRKESCRRGHSLKGDNEVIYANGSRRCRTCMRLNERNRTRSRRRRGELSG